MNPWVWGQRKLGANLKLAEFRPVEEKGYWRDTFSLWVTQGQVYINRALGGGDTTGEKGQKKWGGNPSKRGAHNCGAKRRENCA